jgi:serine protease Do
MLQEFRKGFAGRRFGLRSLVTVAFCSLLGGLLLASGFNLTGVSIAQTPPSVLPAPLDGPRVEGSFAPIAERLSPSVVNIRVTKVQKVEFGMPQLPGGPFGEYFEKFFGDRGGFHGSRPVQGAGSGVIISSDGFILTNNHVVDNAEEVMVTLSDQREIKAEIIGRDPKTDLAVLKISGERELPAARMGDSEALRVGDWVLAIGNPFGLGHTLTSGIVSAKGRVIGAGPYDNFIQTDASINPGNSGGPLFNMSGEVIGINTAINPSGQGIGFAIPIDTAKPLIPQLVKDGEVTRGYIGVNIQSLTPEVAKAFELKDSKGALVAGVVTGGPADKAGIMSGDVIVSFNGKAINDSHELPAIVASTPVGEQSSVTVLRDGRKKDFRLEVAKLPSDDQRAERPGRPAQDKWGLELQNVDPQIARQLRLDVDRGVVVTDVKPGSPADKASMQNGDIILEVNRKGVSSVEEFRQKAADGGDKGSLLLLVQRGGSKLYVALAG